MFLASVIVKQKFKIKTGSKAYYDNGNKLCIIRWFALRVNKASPSLNNTEQV